MLHWCGNGIISPFLAGLPQYEGMIRKHAVMPRQPIHVDMLVPFIADALTPTVS